MHKKSYRSIVARVWKVKIDAADIWKRFPEEVDESFKPLLSALIKRLKSYDEEIFEELGTEAHIRYEQLISVLATAKDYDEFNDYWNQLYDWADANSVWVGVL
jgi:hypothetical protein